MKTGLITKKEAGEILGRSERAIAEWAEAGVLKQHIIKKHAYIDASTVWALKDTDEEIQRVAEERKAALEELKNDVADIQKALGTGYGTPRRVVEAVVHYIEETSEINERAKTIVLEVINGCPFDDLAKMFGMTRERVRQIYEKGMRRITNRLYVFNDIFNEVITLRGEVERLQSEVKVLRDTIEKEKGQEQEPIDSFLLQPITNLDLSVRALNLMKSMDIETIYDLTRICRESFLSGRNVGKKTANEVEDFLEYHGLHWGNEWRVPIRSIRTNQVIRYVWMPNKQRYQIYE